MEQEQNWKEIAERLARVETATSYIQKRLDEIICTLDKLTARLWEVNHQTQYNAGKLWGIAAFVSALVSGIIAWIVQFLSR